MISEDCCRLGRAFSLRVQSVWFRFYCSGQPKTQFDAKVNALDTLCTFVDVCEIGRHNAHIRRIAAKNVLDSVFRR